jgi:hypothetical protein
MEMWPALRSLNLSGCGDGVWQRLEASQDLDDDFHHPADPVDWVYALQFWLMNCPVLEHLNVSRSLGVQEPRLHDVRLFRALAAAPASLSTLIMADLDLTDDSFVSFVNFQLFYVSNSEPILPGLRSLDLSSNRIGSKTLFILAGADPSISMFPALETLTMRHTKLEYTIVSFGDMQRCIIDGLPVLGWKFGKLQELDVFPMDVGTALAMFIMLEVSKTTYATCSLPADEIAMILLHYSGKMSRDLKESATLSVIGRTTAARVQIPSKYARELKLERSNPFGSV